MVGGMHHSGVNPNEAMMQMQNSQQSIIHQNANPMNVPQGGMGLRGNTSMIAPRSQLNENPVETARQFNLAKIQQLQKHLEAAHQQELQYQNQLEVRWLLVNDNLAIFTLANLEIFFQQQPPYRGHQNINMQRPPQQQPQLQQPNDFDFNLMN